MCEIQTWILAVAVTELVAIYLQRVRKEPPEIFILAYNKYIKAIRVWINLVVQCVCVCVCVCEFPSVLWAVSCESWEIWLSS